MPHLLQTMRLNVEINAPLKFVFEWSTDFAEDDPKLIGSVRQRHILAKSSKRVIFAQTWNDDGGRLRVTANIVTLKPPDSWHLEMYESERSETADYKLERLTKESTLLQLTFKNKWKNPEKAETADSQTRRIKEIWAKYSDALQNDYNSRSL
ncbi:MAG: hypothetical protein ACREBS_05370 [Nitrososphaerales archaeon]